jgi:hypothetical protein
MNSTSQLRWILGGAAAAVVAGALAVTLLVLLTKGPGPSRADGGGKPAADAPEAKRKELFKNVALEVQGEERRVIVAGEVCLREGQLEGLLTKKNTKEHEYILTAEVDARHIHAALEAAGAKAGSPVQFQPKYVAASGTTVKITLRYKKDGKVVSVPAQEWVRDVKTQKDLDVDWVFGGSKLFPDPEDTQKPPIYLANQGDLVCVCNMDTAMLDLPISSTKTLANRAYEANSDRVPAVGTKVEIVFEPVKEKKEKEKDK